MHYKISTSKENLFLLLSSLNQFGSTLTSITLLSAVTLEHGGKAAVLTTIAYYLAIPLGSLLLPILHGRINSQSIITITLATRMLILCGLASGENINLYQAAISYFFISGLEAIHNPVKISIVNTSIIDANQKASFFSKIQSIDSLTLILAPLAAALLFNQMNTRYIFLIDAGTYFFGIIFWMAQGKFWNNAPKQSVGFWSGYTLIINTPSLQKINIARILGNSLTVFWTVFLPIAIIGSHSLDDPSKAYATSACSMALGVLAAGAILSYKYGYRKIKSTRFPMIHCTAFVVIFLLTINITLVRENIYFIEIVVAAFSIGYIISMYRSSIMIIGQRVTPPEILNLVIAAGDSVVRIASAAIAASYAMIITSLSSYPAALLAVLYMAGIFAALGIFILYTIDAATHTPESLKKT